MRRLAAALSPIARMACGRRADEDQAGVGAGLREVGALAQEAVAGVHGVGAGACAPRRAARRCSGTTRPPAARRCAPPRRPAHMRRAGVGVAEDGHRAVAQRGARCASRGRRSRRGWRPGSCGTPSTPRGLASLRHPARLALLQEGESCLRCPRARARPARRPRPRRCTSDAGVREARLAPSAPWWRPRRRARIAGCSASTRGQRMVERAGGVHRVHQAQCQRRLRIEPAAGDGQALGLGIAQPLDEEGRDLRRHHAERRSRAGGTPRSSPASATSTTQARPRPPPITVPSSTATVARPVLA